MSTRFAKLKKSAPSNTPPEKSFFTSYRSLGSKKNDRPNFFPVASTTQAALDHRSVQAERSKVESDDRQAEPTQQVSAASIVQQKGQPEDSQRKELIAPSQRFVSPQLKTAKVIQRQLLPVGRHRELVKDAALRLTDAEKASDKEWIRALYEELGGEGNPPANKCVEKLIEQRIIDQNDWNLIEKDFILFKSKGKKALDLHERHNIPTVHGEGEADKWVASLIKNRIDDLYATVQGFPGHAQQVQQEIDRLGAWYREGVFSQEKYLGYVDRILTSLRKGKRESRLAIPDWTYSFFEAGNRQV